MANSNKVIGALTAAAAVESSSPLAVRSSPVMEASRWTLALVVLIWLSLFMVLTTDWSINPQYSYGWVVPLLAFIAFKDRWASRPFTARQPLFESRPVLGLCCLLLLVALPIRLIEEANPEWRLVLWSHAIWAILLSFCLLGLNGGRAWVGYFAFPVLFPLISVPLPMVIETAVIQRLTRMVSFLSTELANLTGIPAIQHGNLIEIGNGTLGVEEACSGIRSLQSLLLVSLFLGEFYCFHRGRRVILVLAGIAIAIVSNIARTYALVHVAAWKGLAASQEVHDTAATCALVGALVSLFVVAAWLRPKKTAEHPAGTPDVSAAPFRTAGGCALPKAWAIGATAWLVLVGVGVEVWFRSHEAGATAGVQWSLREPTTAEGYRAMEIPDAVKATLRFSKGHSVLWRDGQANHWRLYFLRWDAGRNSAQLAKGHTPEICLTGAGGELTERLGAHTVQLGALSLNFDQYVFEFSGQPLHVFYCLWEDRKSNAGEAISEDGTQGSRLSAALAGKRHLGQAVIEAAVRGPASAEEARALFTQELSRLIVQ